VSEDIVVINLQAQLRALPELTFRWVRARVSCLLSSLQRSCIQVSGFGKKTDVTVLLS
jgi:hypothetical protein